MDLATPVNRIPNIGVKFQKKLHKLGIQTVGDLLFHFPHRYEDFSVIEQIKNIKPGVEVCVYGKILGIQNSRTWKKRMAITEAIVEDRTAPIKAVWFNQPYLVNTLKKGDQVYLAGKVSVRKGEIFLSNPSYEKAKQSNNLTHTGRIIPVYPETEGLSSRWLRYIIKPVLQKIRYQLKEPLPQELLERQKLLPLSEAIWQVHFPASIKLAEKAKQRFIFEELFLIELSVLMEKQKIRQEKAPAIPINISAIKKLVEKLPFSLTDAQRKCAWRILKDLEKTQPMNRLLQGDVGSGKTVVATIAALGAAKAGYQTAFMAPTEILAKQHFKEISKLLRPFKVRTALLTGKEDKIVSLKLKNENIEISRKKLLERTANGEINVLIGTHALIQKHVKFGNLALVVVDEQHRFGVEQRAKLARRSKNLIPHFLSMSATPIPRSLALTVYGSLDLSIIDELPKGRKKTITKVVSPNQRNSAYNFIRARIKKGEQAFVICPRIEPGKGKNSTWSEVKAVKEEYQKLSNEVFPEFSVGMLHGKMKSKEKEAVMDAFRKKRIDLLVSTSVVEVGVDIPGATIMLIEGADRFGLAQLHQFRGRIGRSNLQSWCFLFTTSPGLKTSQRLRAMAKTNDGFKLAEMDLKIRGPGSVYGAKQWGIPDLAMANLGNVALIEKTREAAQEVLEEDPELHRHPELRQRIRMTKASLHLE